MEKECVMEIDMFKPFLSSKKPGSELPKVNAIVNTLVRAADE